MADAAGLGNALSQSFVAQQLGSDKYKQLLQAQQQKALADSLMQQGTTPIDTNNRQIGGVGYKISPMEGVAKLAQALGGAYGETQANSKLADALAPSQSAQGANGGSDPIVSSMPPPTQSIYNRLMLPESMGGNPRAGVELYNTFASGMKSYGSGVGTAAAGMAPAGTLPAGVGGGQPPSAPPMQPPPSPQGAPVANGNPAPVAPVQPSPLPPIGGTPDPQQQAALASYRQQNGLQTPPIDNQRAAAGLPVGVGSNLPNGSPMMQGMPQGGAQPIPQVPSSALQPPAPQQIQAMPMPMSGESNDAYQARLAAAKAGATALAQVQPSGDKATAEDAGKNLADAQKTFNVAASNLPRAMQRFTELRQAAPLASSGGGISDEPQEQGFFEHFLPGPDYARSMARSSIGGAIDNKIAGGNVADANMLMDQATKQGVLSELGPQMQGLKGNKYLEGIANGASGLNLADPPDTKVKAINGLQDQYISNLKSLAQQRRTYGDPTAPSDMDLATLVSKNADPSTTVSIVTPQGVLGRVSPQHLPSLIQDGGQLR